MCTRWERFGSRRAPDAPAIVLRISGRRSLPGTPLAAETMRRQERGTICARTSLAGKSRTRGSGADEGVRQASTPLFGERRRARKSAYATSVGGRSENYAALRNCAPRRHSHRDPSRCCMPGTRRIVIFWVEAWGGGKWFRNRHGSLWNSRKSRSSNCCHRDWLYCYSSLA